MWVIDMIVVELVSSAGFQQPKQCLNNRGGDTAPLEVDEWGCGRRASHLGWTLNVVKKVMGVNTNEGNAALVGAGLHLSTEVVKVAHGSNQLLKILQCLQILRRDMSPGLGQAGNLVAGQSDSKLSEGGKVTVSAAVRRDVDELGETSHSLFKTLSKNNFGNGPFDHDVEASDDYLNAMSIRVAEEINPRARITVSSVFPVHVYELFPVDFIKCILLDESKLLRKNFRVKSQDERQMS
ncbi:hypothetical protein HG531_010901 [Fusarium graminearum]|nr:hypothetical protein HG531_010901 [Fusarium graminearum]